MLLRAWFEAMTRKVGQKGNLAAPNRTVAAVHCTGTGFYVRQWLELLHSDFHNQHKPGAENSLLLHKKAGTSLCINVEGQTYPQHHSFVLN